jgi:dolichol kinase
MSAAIPTDVVRLLVVGAACGGVLALAESFRFLRLLRPEETRKLVHVLMGLIAATFPWVFRSSWTVAALCAAFGGLMAWSRKRHALLSVNGVARRSWGGVYFPLAIAIVFPLARERPEWFVASILVLAVSDAVAAVAGQACGRHVYRMGPDPKSLEGSLAFFASALACVYVPLSVIAPAATADHLWQAAYAAIVATCLEGAASDGRDNLFIPLGTCLTLVCVAEGGACRQVVAALALALTVGAAWRVVSPVRPVGPPNVAVGES